MGGQGFLLLMELNFNNDDQAQNIIVACHYNFKQLIGNSNVLQTGHRYQKNLFSSTASDALATYFDVTSFSAWPFLDSCL